MKRPTRQELSAWILIAALVANAWIHFRSPAYRYYREQSEQLDERVSAFESRVRDEFVPALKDIATNMVAAVSSPSPFGLQSSGDLVQRGGVEFVQDYRSQYARTGGYVVSGCFIDGHFYRLGDRYLGSPIIEIEPSCAFTRDFVIRPSKVRSAPSPNSPPASAPEKGNSDAKSDN